MGDDKEVVFPSAQGKNGDDDNGDNNVSRPKSTVVLVSVAHVTPLWLTF
jgi:hypothetical protein